MGILEEYHIWEHIISIKISIKYQYQNISLKEYHIREWKKKHILSLPKIGNNIIVII